MGALKMDEKKAGSDAFEWAYDHYIKDDPERVASFKTEMARLEIAQRIYDIRTKLALTREQLAEISGLGVSVIEALEEANYEDPLDEPIGLINKAFRKWVKNVIVPAAQLKPAEYSVEVAPG